MRCASANSPVSAARASSRAGALPPCCKIKVWGYMTARSSKGSSLIGNIVRRLWRDVGWRWHKVLAAHAILIVGETSLDCLDYLQIALEYLLYLSDRLLALKGVTSVGKLER